MSGERDVFHIDATLDALRRAWLARPEWRLTQLVENAAMASGAKVVFHCEDERLKEGLETVRESLRTQD